MPMVKIAVTIDEEVAKEIDRLVAMGRYPNRSKIVQLALREIMGDAKKMRLAAECAKLCEQDEKAMAEEALESDLWPEY